MIELLVVATFLFGVAVGIAAFVRFTSAGILRIDHTNQEKDTYRFEIDDIDSLNKKHYLVLTIDHDADLSRK